MAFKIQNGADLVSTSIINVADPSSAQDASTKNYTDLSAKKFGMALSMIVGF